MIDAELLRSLGWSEELIQTAGQVAEQVATGAVVGSVGEAVLTLTTVSPETAGSERIDVSGPPVAQPQLRVGR